MFLLRNKKKKIIDFEYSKEFKCSPGLQIRVCIGKLFSLFLIQNICCGYSKESSQGDGSFEHPKHMFKLMGKKIIEILHNKISLSRPMIHFEQKGISYQKI